MFPSCFSTLRCYSDFDKQINRVRGNILNVDIAIEIRFRRLVCTANSLYPCRKKPFLRTRHVLCLSLMFYACESDRNKVKHFMINIRCFSRVR